MIEKSVRRLQYLCESVPSLLLKIDETNFSFKPSENKWSRKEILGHLIDSAANNHQRFVRAQFEIMPAISYDQNNWNKHSFYNEIETAQLIEFWTSYNKQLVAIFELMPQENLQRVCNVGGQDNFSIEFLFDDYVQHLEHHLKQILDYKL
jgi:hypothetical protein